MPGRRGFPGKGRMKGCGVANLEHWNLVQDFTAHQAAALAVGTEPIEYDEEAIGDIGAGPPAYYVVWNAMKRAYEDALNAVDGARTWPTADDGPDKCREFFVTYETTPMLFSRALAEEVRRIMNDEVASFEWREFGRAHYEFTRQRFERRELDRWFRANGAGFLPMYRFATDGGPAPTNNNKPCEKPMGNTERNTLLRIIAVLAVRGYGIDPKASRIEKLGEVRRDAEELGLSVSDDTLRAKLREAFDMIEKSAPTAR